MNITSSIFKSFLGTFLLLSGSLHATTLVDDQFADGNRTTQNLPSSVNWYSGLAGSTLTASVGSMTMSLASGSNQFVGYFTNSGAPLVLAAGQTITLNYTFSIQGGNTTGGKVTFGLFDSGGSRVSADDEGLTSTTFRNYTGYASSSTLKSNASSKITLYQRETSSTGLLSSTNNPPYTTLADSGSIGGYKLVDGVSYTGSFSVYYDGTQTVITQTLTGGSLSNVTYSYVDATPTLSYDTIAFFVQGTTASSVTFTDINLTVVPEPKTKAMMTLGLLAITFYLRKWYPLQSTGR